MTTKVQKHADGISYEEYEENGVSVRVYGEVVPIHRIWTKRRVLTCIAAGVLLAFVLVGVAYVASGPNDGEVMYEQVWVP